MFTMTDCINKARTVAAGSPAWNAATSLCVLRHLDPYAMSMDSPLQNWQQIIVEQLIGACIVQEVM